MKKMVCCLLALIALIAPATAEDVCDSVRVAFEDGFSLSLPADWVRYDVAPELSEAGFIYCLGSADGARLMYVQRWNTGCADLSELEASLSSRPEIELRTSVSDGESAGFLTYNFTDADCSGCATLFDGTVLNLLFLPQSDAENMLLAATIMESAGLE